MQTFDFDRPVFGKMRKILGNVGNGKNVLAVALVRWMAGRCVHNKLTAFNGQTPEYCLLCVKYGIKTEQERILKCHANFPMGGSAESLVHTEKIGRDLSVECFFMQTPDDFLSIKPSRQHMIWIIDEGNKFGLESRRSMSEDNIEVADRIQECRKYNADYTGITQLATMQERRMRFLSETTLALPHGERSFNYAYYIGDQIIGMEIPFKYAKENIYPCYKTEFRIEEQDDDDYIQEPAKSTENGEYEV